MGRKHKKRKHCNTASYHHHNQQQQQNQEQQHTTLTEMKQGIELGAATDHENKSSTVMQWSLEDDELQITIETLKDLSRNMDYFATSKQCKELRRVLHPFILSQMQSYNPVDYTIKVTNFLSNQKWSNAHLSLKACKDFDQVPKQGTVQRWVRDCEAAPAKWKMKLLSAILETTKNNNDCTNNDEKSNNDNNNIINPNKHDVKNALLNELAGEESTTNNNNDSDNSNESNFGNDNEVKVLPAWKIPKNDHPNDISKTNEQHDENKHFHDDKLQEPIPNLKSEIIYRENAHERTPPNKYDLLLHYCSSPDVIQFDNREKQDTSSMYNIPPIKKYQIPFLKSNMAFCMTNVLSESECFQLCHVATQLGYRPNHPITMDTSTGIDCCEWLINDTIQSTIFNRIQQLLPQEITTSNSTKFLYKINPRWRVFRYGTNCVYRPHIDGSWPESKLYRDDTKNGSVTYQCDETGSTNSYLTCLVYLNDNFEGGETKYFFTSNSEMVAQGITPQRGTIVIFPQGNIASLIHEGSAVTKGIKYVIRTDILYRER